MKKLQVALDLFDTKAALDVLAKVGEFVDIIELGTPLMVSEGCRAIGEVKSRYPDKIVFADIKIMDGGAIMSELVFKAGADMTSVLAAAEDATIKGVIGCAKKYERKTLVDMCAVNDLAGRARHLATFGPDYISVHVGTDVQGAGGDPIAQLRMLEGIPCAKAAAGGIKLANFEAACQSPTDVIIVGGGLYNQPDPRDTAIKMRELLTKYA